MLENDWPLYLSSRPPPDAIWAFGSNQLYVTGQNGTAGIFATYPSQHLNIVNGFFDQVSVCWEDEGAFQEESFGVVLGLSFS